MSDCCTVKGESQLTRPVFDCPVCGSHSKRVGALTVKALIHHLSFGAEPTQYYFCKAPGCDVVYFPSNPKARTYHRDELLVRVGIKEECDPITICYCFGVTRESLWEEIRETGGSTAAERVKAEVKAGACACEVKNPSGKCCLGEVGRAVREGLRRLRGSAVTG